MRLKHTLHNQRCHSGISRRTFSVICLDIITCAVIFHIIAYGGHKVIGAVTAYTALEMQLFSQPLFLNEALGSQGDSTTLRISHAERAPVALYWQQLIFGRFLCHDLLIEFHSIHYSIQHLLCSQTLREIGMRSVLGYTIALIVGHDDDATGCIVGIFCRILASIITSGHEYCKVLVIRNAISCCGTLVVGSNGDVV